LTHEHVEYFPYGEAWRDQRSDVGASPVKGQRFLFTGKELDEETGLYYFGARYYDPVRVRWVSADPIVQRWTDAPDPRKLSLFAYALWSPQRLLDPDGEDPVESRILEKPISAEYLERSGLLDKVSVAYLEQHGLLREAIAPQGAQLVGLQSSEQDLLDVEREFLFGAFPVVVGAAASSFATPGQQRGFSASADAGATEATEASAPRTVTVNRSRFPQSAQHIEDAQSAGRPSTLTIDRAGAAARRRASLKGVKTAPGLDRDEYPPAMFKEGGQGASVRRIPAGDNRGAGACLGAQCRDLPEGSRVKVEVTE
jgi:RHS repeat-associated protein